MLRRAVRLVIGVAGVLVISAGVAAADRCHTPLAGTRSLTLEGNVTGYRFADGGVAVDWARSPSCAGRTLWRYAAGRRARPALACRARASRTLSAASSALAASSGDRIVRVGLASVRSDAPNRLLVFDRVTNRRVASWPLVQRPARVALFDGVAILSGSTRGALYALRLSDGRIAQIGITRAHDRPLIGPAGVVYQSDLDLKKHRTAPRERTLNLLPLATVQRELSRPFSTVRKYMSYSKPPRSAAAAGTRPRMYRGADPARPFTGPPITAMAMDGSRVALAVRDPAGRCDYVLFWNVPWHYVTRLTRYQGTTCIPGGAPGRITNVGIGGSRATWVTSFHGVTRLLAASITGCVEWVVARPAGDAHAVIGLSGSGTTLAYAIGDAHGGRSSGTVGIVGAHWRGQTVERSAGKIIGISSDSARIAVLRQSGVVDVRTSAGNLLETIHVGRARALSLRENTLAVLGNRTLRTYGTASAELRHSWRVPPGTTTVDVHFGIALLTAGRNVDALDLTTGRSVRLFHAPAPVMAQLDAPGAAIAFNAHGRSNIRFLPMSVIEAQLR